VASTVRGADLLAEHGWDAATTALGEPIGLCVPAILASFIKVRTSPHLLHLLADRRQLPAKPMSPAEPETARPVRAGTHDEREAIVALGNLTNHLLTHKASKTLAKLRGRSPEIFASPELLYRTLHLLEIYHYRLPARRFIFDLLSLPLTPDTLRQVAEAGAALAAKQANETFTLDEDGLATPLTSTHGWMTMGKGRPMAEFSDEEDEAIETVPKQTLAPQLVVRGFHPPGPTGQAVSVY
jgi:hypothetical protein